MPKDDTFYNSHEYFNDLRGDDSATGLQDGDLYDNQYRIIHKIGAGGMGTVYLVEDTLMQDRKALKMIRREMTRDLHVRQRFLQEVALSQRIMSWNVVRVHTARQCDDDVYYTMEYLEGKTLREWLDTLLETGEMMPPEDIRRIMTDVCRGLADAHQITLHRDLKPENIFIDADGCAKLLDFGLARALKGTGLTMAAQKMGTAYYMAPEQLSKKTVKPAVSLDIYSLGVILYEMLTSSLPIGAFRAVCDHREDISNTMDEFIRGCLSVRPEDRPATAAEFFKEFDGIIGADIEALQKRRLAEETQRKRDAQYAGAAARACAVKPDDPDTALVLWKELARQYPEKTEASVKVEEFQKQIMKRDEEHRQAEEARQRELAEQAEARRREAAGQEKKRIEGRIAEARSKSREAEEAGRLEPALAILKKMEEAFPGRPDIAGDIQRIEGRIDAIRKEREAKAAEERRREDDERKRLERQAREAKRRQEATDLEERSSHSSGRKRQIIGWSVAVCVCLIGFFWLITQDSGSPAVHQVALQPTMSTAETPAHTASPRPTDADPGDTRRDQVAALMRRADDYYYANKLTSPSGENAVEVLRQVLSIEAGNRDALGMLDQIAGKYESWGDAKASSGDWSAARKHYESSLFAKEDAAIRIKLDQAIAQLSVTPTPTHTQTPTATPTPTPTSTPTVPPTRTPIPTPKTQTTGTVSTIDLGNGVTLDLVYIAGSRFQMGSPSGEKDRDSDERPVHTVELDGFWMGKYEVTQAQYEAVMGTNPSNFQGSNRPVEKVSWNDAMEFCRKLSQRTGRTVTLPTEAQWEYACRAGSQSRFCFGDSDNGLGSYAWYSGNSKSKTHPVGQKKANAWGLYDMHGNVYEWCLDWRGTYPSGSVRNPVGPGSGSLRVFRGGSWFYYASYCRSAHRDSGTPESRNSNRGFRLAAPL